MGDGVGIRLTIRQDGLEVSALDIGRLPALVGRDAANALAVRDEAVSGRHAELWTEGGGAFLRDLRSRNGTFVNGERVNGTVKLSDGDLVRLGPTFELWVRGHADDGRAGVLVVEDIEAGIYRRLAVGRTTLGAGDDGASLSLDGDGELWLSSMDDERALEPDETFEVGGRKMRVVSLNAHLPGETLEVGPAEPAAVAQVHLAVRLDGVAGAEATLTDPANGRSYVIDAENRAVLLYVLARRAVEARAAGRESDTWCADDDVTRDIWGKRGVTDANSLHVLVHRLRKEIKAAGFDPWFIEKRRKAIRLALTDILVG